MSGKEGDYMTVGQKIKKLREENKISQLELSKAVGINNSVMSRIELDERPIRDDELVKIADFFDVSADYLLGRTIVRKQADTFAAHSDSDMSDEAKAELDSFKEYLKMKYSKK